MEFTLTIKGDAQELAALLSQIKVPAGGMTAATNSCTAFGLVPADTGITPEPEALPEEPVAATPPPATNGQVKATRTRKPATVVEAVEEAPTPVVAAQQAAATAAGTVVSHVPVTLDALRKVMKTKLKHQAQIVEWLTEYGAKNLSTLDAAHYEDMYSKLITLQ